MFDGSFMDDGSSMHDSTSMRDGSSAHDRNRSPLIIGIHGPSKPNRLVHGMFTNRTLVACIMLLNNVCIVSATNNIKSHTVSMKLTVILLIYPARPNTWHAQPCCLW